MVVATAPLHECKSTHVAQAWRPALHPYAPGTWYGAPSGLPAAAMSNTRISRCKSLHQAARAGRASHSSLLLRTMSIHESMALLLIWLTASAFERTAPIEEVQNSI